MRPIADFPWHRLPDLILAAAAAALAELVLALLIGGFLSWGRAEALLFFAFRPAVLTVAVFYAGRYPPSQRALFYFLVLTAASASEALFLISLGADNPWPELGRGFAAGATLALVLDLAVTAIRRSDRVLGGWRHGLSAALVLFLFASPFGLDRYYRLARQPTRGEAPTKPDLMLMTGLPIIWGEKGAFDPSSRPAEAYRALQREFNVRPLDALTGASLASGDLLLLAQPRALAPEELVALDAWVRGGGRVLILTDPDLRWPSDLPLGDIRRPPQVGLLKPLLDHWGVTLAESPLAPRRTLSEIRLEGRKLRLASPAHFQLGHGDCALAQNGLIATCSIGRGKAVLVAGADFLQDSRWIGKAGPAREARLADNPLVVADMLDGLAGLQRLRADGEVVWVNPDASVARAITFASSPILFLCAAALILRRKTRR